MKAFLEDTFEYTHRSNAMLIAVLLRNPEMYVDRISLLAGHVLDAHHIWNHRIIGAAPALSVWQPLELNHLNSLNNENLTHSKEIIQQKDFSGRAHV